MKRPVKSDRSHLAVRGREGTDEHVAAAFDHADIRGSDPHGSGASEAASP
jgi:hypothetical protein